MLTEIKHTRARSGRIAKKGKDCGSGLSDTPSDHSPHVALIERISAEHQRELINEGDAQ